MDVFLKVVLRVTGVILCIALIIAFLVPLTVAFLVLLLIQTVFRIRIRKNLNFPPFREPLPTDCSMEEDIIDVEAVEVPGKANQGE